MVPYYQRLQECVEAALKHSPLVLVLTVRSYSSRPLEFEKNRRYPRPQATVSSEEGLTPQGLADLALRSLRAFHWWAGPSGRPEGAAWLPPMLRGRPRVKALGLSLCRRLYMDEQTGRSAESLPGARRVLGTLFNLLEQEVDRVGRLRLDRARGSGKIPSPVIKAASL